MKALVIGFGSIGQRHARLLRDEFAASVEIVSSRGSDEYQSYKDLTSVPSLDSYDYYVIASETHLHIKHLEFLNSNLSNKKILVEKPLSAKASDFSNFKSNNQIFVAYNLRFHPLIQKLKNEIANQDITHVNIITGQYLPSWRPDRDYRQTYSASKEKGGGVLLDLSHELDYAQCLFGKITSIKAVNKKVSDLEIDSDDYFSAVAETDKGVCLNVTLDYLSKISIKQILVHSNQNTYRGDLIANNLESADKEMNLENILSDKVERDVSFIDMHKAVLSDGADVCSYEEGLSVLELIGKV